MPGKVRAPGFHPVLQERKAKPGEARAPGISLHLAILCGGQEKEADKQLARQGPQVSLHHCRREKQSWAKKGTLVSLCIWLLHVKGKKRRQANTFQGKGPGFPSIVAGEKSKARRGKGPWYLSTFGERL